MSVLSAIAKSGTNKFIVPCAGKMFHSSISKRDSALCFVLNKGYFETQDLISMTSILDDASEIKDFILVGSVDKVVQHGVVYYRQRIFFKSLGKLLQFCKSFGLRFELDSDFRISINSILNCVDDLIFLERYAKRFDETIDTWLTHCCIIELHYYMRSLGLYSTLGDKVDKYLENRVDYLGRAPFLISSYSIDNRNSGIFLGFDIEDSRLYKEYKTGKDLLKLGFTKKGVLKDLKGGKFYEGKVNKRASIFRR